MRDIGRWLMRGGRGYWRWGMGPSAWWMKVIAWTGAAFAGMVVLGAAAGGQEGDTTATAAVSLPAATARARVEVTTPSAIVQGTVVSGIADTAVPQPPAATIDPTEAPSVTPPPLPTVTATPVPTATATPVAPGTPALVVRVIDGDTVELSDGSRVRFIGIDTPETVAPGQPVDCYGPEASARTKQLVEGQSVYLEKDVSETDQFGRLLRYVYLGDGTMLNELLVLEGFASSSTYPPDVKYQERFLAAERVARESGTGLWGQVCLATPTPIPTATIALPTPVPFTAIPPPAAAPPQASNCHPSYAGACLNPNASDYDCAGGSGNGPYYTGRVTVVGPDVFRLDGDGDGIGCE